MIYFESRPNWPAFDRLRIWRGVSISHQPDWILLSYLTLYYIILYYIYISIIYIYIYITYITTNSDQKGASKAHHAAAMSVWFVRNWIAPRQICSLWLHQWYHWGSHCRDALHFMRTGDGRGAVFHVDLSISWLQEAEGRQHRQSGRPSFAKKSWSFCVGEHILRVSCWWYPHISQMCHTSIIHSQKIIFLRLKIHFSPFSPAFSMVFPLFSMVFSRIFQGFSHGSTVAPGLCRQAQLGRFARRGLGGSLRPVCAWQVMHDTKGIYYIVYIYTYIIVSIYIYII